MHLRRSVVLVTVLAAVGALPPASSADVPYPASADRSAPYDYAEHLFIDDGDCDESPSDQLPEGFDCEDNWRLSDDRGNEPDFEEATLLEASSNANLTDPQELFGVKGAGANQAWEVTTGRPDVVIAVLDSGIRWEEDREDLEYKYHLNCRELPPPPGAAPDAAAPFCGYDVDGDVDHDGTADGRPDGVLNVVDYWGHPDARDFPDDRNDDLDPSDLIRVFSDGIDGDGNGYVDDISGWDFFEDDNDPQDDTDYSHGTGEAQGSTAEAGRTEEGTCPNCMMMPLRVGDSFIADVNHFAEAVVYGVDNGAAVIQEALGTLNHTSFGQEALDHAYRNGVIVNASEADEAAGHHNWPAAYEHTMVVNSVRQSTVTQPHGYTWFNGCTNFGGYTYVAIPSSSCSSDATGLSSGYSGLLVSAARNAVDRGEMTPYVRDDGTPAPFALSAEEAYQLWRLAADDLDHASPCVDGVGDEPDLPVHEFCDEAAPYGDQPHRPRVAPADDFAVTAPPGTTRYQAVKGWDQFTGYGRSNAARLVRYIGRPGYEYVPDEDGFTPYPGPNGADDSPLDAQDRIPPEADITAPRWWQQYPVTEDGYLLLPDDPDRPAEIVVEGRVAANRVTAEGGTFDWVLEWAPHVQGLKTSQYAAAGGYQPASGSEEDSHGPWVEVARGERLTAAYEGPLGTIPVADVLAALADNPNPFDPVTDPTSRFLPERNAVRLRLRVIAHPVDPADTVNNEAVRQKQVDVYSAEESTIRDDLGLDGRVTGGAGSPSFHDVDGDGDDELLLATSDGLVHAYTDLRTGEELPGWPVATDPYPGVTEHAGAPAYRSGAVRTDVSGAVLAGTPAVADLDDDGEIEVIVADLEGRVSVWSADGSRRLTVEVDRSLSQEPACTPETIPACDDFSDGPPKRNRWNARDWGINYAPAIGDLDPTYAGLEIVTGANDGHIYAWHADGTPVPGWPVVLRDPATVEWMDPTTRFWCYDQDGQEPECAGRTDGAGPVEPAIGTKVLVTPSLADLDADGDLEVVVGVNEEYAEDPNWNDAQDPGLAAIGQVSGPGNTRIYALHHTGAATPETDASRATPHVHDQAYVAGWPVPIGLAVLNLLPYVGAGTNSQAVIADVDPGADGGKLEIAIASAAGPGYILNDDGTSYLGVGPDGDFNVLATGAHERGEASEAKDFSSVVGVGGLAIGSMDGGGHLTVAGPAAGLQRLLDVVIEGQQVLAEDHLALWTTSMSPGATRPGDYEPNAPIIVNDLQFFTPPAFADVTGDGEAEVIQGTAMLDTVVASRTDTSTTATRYHSGGWTVSSAGVGDAPLGAEDDGRLHIATVTREGYLRTYATPVEAGTAVGCSALTEWPEAGHDPFNTGTYGTDAIRPYPVRDLGASVERGEVHLTLTATGDDRGCGRAARYEVRAVDGRGDDPQWEDARPVEFRAADEPAPAGEADTIVVPRRRGVTTYLVRAYDEAGNGSAVRAVVVHAGGNDRGGRGPQP